MPTPKQTMAAAGAGAAAATNNESGLAPWLARRARIPVPLPREPPPSLLAEVSAIMLGAGDVAGAADDAAVALLARYVASHVSALMRRTLDEAAVLLSDAAVSGAPPPQLDGGSVAAALRSAGAEHHATRVAHVLAKHTLLTRQLLVCDLSGPGAEREAYAAWGERAAITPATRAGVLGKTKLAAEALSDTIVALPPAGGAAGKAAGREKRDRDA